MSSGDNDVVKPQMLFYRLPTESSVPMRLDKLEKQQML